MRKRKKYGLIIFLLITFSILVFIAKEFLYEEENKIYKISVIIRGKSSESWMITKEGIDQAATDMNVDISFIALSDENSLYEQKELVKREVDDGADAIIISPTDYEKMDETIKNVIEKIPVVLMESTIKSGENIPYISCDNYEIGRSLAEEMIQSGNYRKNIAVVDSSSECSSIRERYNGFIDVINESKNNYVLWNIDFNDEGVYESIKKLIEEKNVDVIVALEPSALEVIAQGKKELISQFKEDIFAEIYGVGSTSKIIALLEEGIIKSIIVQNDFNVGYLSVQAAMDTLNGEEYKNRKIEFSIINKRNMYSDENQRLLFPFVR